MDWTVLAGLAVFALAMIAWFAWTDHAAQKAWREEMGPEDRKP